MDTRTQPLLQVHSTHVQYWIPVQLLGDNSNGQGDDDTTTDKINQLKLQVLAYKQFRICMESSHTCLVTSQGLADDRTTQCWETTRTGQLETVQTLIPLHLLGFQIQITYQ